MSVVFVHVNVAECVCERVCVRTAVQRLPQCARFIDISFPVYEMAFCKTTYSQNGFLNLVCLQNGFLKFTKRLFTKELIYKMAVLNFEIAIYKTYQFSSVVFTKCLLTK